MPGKAPTTQAGTLQAILEKMTSIETMSEIVHEHDRTLPVVLETLKTSNKVLEKLSEGFEELKEAQAKYWNQQTLMNTQNESMLKQLDENLINFRIITKRQTETGCPWALAQVEKRTFLFNAVDVQLAHVNKELLEQKTLMLTYSDRLAHNEDLIKQNASKLDTLITKVEPLDKEAANTWKTIKTKLIDILVTLIITSALLKWGITYVK